eukprot:2311692-Rhodomonas_salina.1
MMIVVPSGSVMVPPYWWSPFLPMAKWTLQFALSSARSATTFDVAFGNRIPCPFVSRTMGFPL